MNTPELNEMQTMLHKIGAELDKIASKCVNIPAGSFQDKDADEVLKSVREAKSHISAANTKLTSWQGGDVVDRSAEARNQFIEPAPVTEDEKEKHNKRGKH